MDARYPKPGNPNPLVDVHTFSLETYLTTGSLGLAKQSLTWPGEMPRESRVLMEVGWVADHALLVKEVDRAARTGSVVLFTNNQSEGKVVRKLGKDGEEGDDGWIDHVSLIIPIGLSVLTGQGQDIIPLKGDVDGYLDMVPNNGYMHIALFTPLDATEPVWLTAGEWEVASIDGYNAETQTVFVLHLRNKSSISRLMRQILYRRIPQYRSTPLCRDSTFFGQPGGFCPEPESAHGLVCTGILRSLVLARGEILRFVV
jgi:dipeptidyl aminopeptidase